MRAALLMGLVVLSGCVAPNGGTGGGAGGGGGSSIDADQMQLHQLQTQLETHRTQALDKSDSDIEPAGAVFYYKRFDNFSPTLHRVGADGHDLAYGFTIGAGDDANERNTADLVVNAEKAGDHITYHVFDALQADTEKGHFQLPSPSDEQKWWAYAVSGSTVYVITTPGTNTGNDHEIWTWSPGGTVTQLTTLEAMGMTPGELWDFDVSGSTMMLIEAGRLWHIDLGAKTAHWLQNMTEIAGAVDFEADGAVFEDSTGLKFFEYSTGTLRDISAELQASSYQLNGTYKTAHDFYSKTTGSNFSRFGPWVVYTANMGIFAYDLVGKRVAPVLIDVSTDDGHRVDYTYPEALDNGVTYVVGLTSEDGAVGADGPVYRTDLSQVLPQ